MFKVNEKGERRVTQIASIPTRAVFANFLPISTFHL
uniref:Uncharacterized protein n=1 Tax=Parascaris equorum TaxID=6256 RepID=A0A914RFU6_PAREQ